MRRILIVKTSAIGDVIQAFQTVSYLKARWPDVQIDWVIEKRFEHLVCAHPLIDQVLCIDSKSWKKRPLSPKTIKEVISFIKRLKQQSYDCLFDLQGNIKSSFVDYFARASVKVGFGAKSVAERPNLLFTDVQIDVEPRLNIYDRYITLLKKFYNDSEEFSSSPLLLKLDDADKLRLLALLSHQILGSGSAFMLSFGSNWKNKRLSQATLSAFIEWSVKELGACFVIPYASEEEEVLAKKWQSHHPAYIQAIGGLTLPLWQHVMNHTRGVVCMDSAALALSSLAHIPSMSIFGPTSSYVYKPRGKKYISVEGSCPYGQPFVSRCKYLRTCRTGACIKDITLSQLQGLFERFIHTAKAVSFASSSLEES